MILIRHHPDFVASILPDESFVRDDDDKLNNDRRIFDFEALREIG